MIATQNTIFRVNKLNNTFFKTGPKSVLFGLTLRSQHNMGKRGTASMLRHLTNYEVEKVSKCHVNFAELPSNTETTEMNVTHL